jgi:hypothetical protein
LVLSAMAGSVAMATSNSSSAGRIRRLIRYSSRDDPL